MRFPLPTNLALSLTNLASDRVRLTRSSVALLATILVHILLLLILLLTRAPLPPEKAENDLKTFSVMPDPARKAPGAKPKQVAKKAAVQPSPPARPVVPTPEPPPVAAPSIIPVTKDVFAASNIANLPSQGKGGGSTGAGINSAAVAGPGEGPGGVQLYEAEWYRRPTNMELSSYLPANAPTDGWGLVACKTIEDFHVENCQSLGESPPGSGLARAVRQAAWQFLVRPPRIDGKPQVGAWVRIRIDYSQRARAE